MASYSHQHVVADPHHCAEAAFLRWSHEADIAQAQSIFGPLRNQRWLRLAAADQQPHQLILRLTACASHCDIRRDPAGSVRPRDSVPPLHAQAAVLGIDISSRLPGPPEVQVRRQNAPTYPETISYRTVFPGPVREVIHGRKLLDTVGRSARGFRAADRPNQYRNHH